MAHPCKGYPRSTSPVSAVVGSNPNFCNVITHNEICREGGEGEAEERDVEGLDGGGGSEEAGA